MYNVQNVAYVIVLLFNKSRFIMDLYVVTNSFIHG